MAECFGTTVNVVGKPADDGPVCPTTFIFQRLGQIPVIERNPGFDAQLQAGINYPVVEGKTTLIDRTRSLGHDARPG